MEAKAAALLSLKGDEGFFFFARVDASFCFLAVVAAVFCFLTDAGTTFRFLTVAETAFRFLTAAGTTFRFLPVAGTTFRFLTGVGRDVRFDADANTTLRLLDGVSFRLFSGEAAVGFNVSFSSASKSVPGSVFTSTICNGGAAAWLKLWNSVTGAMPSTLISTLNFDSSASGNRLSAVVGLFCSFS